MYGVGGSSFGLNFILFVKVILFSVGVSTVANISEAECLCYSSCETFFFI